VVGIFQPTDHGGGSSEHLGQFALRKSSFGADLMDDLGDLHILTERGPQIKVLWSRRMPTIEDSGRAAGCALLSAHISAPLDTCAAQGWTQTIFCDPERV